MKKFFAILLTCAMFLPLLTACSSLQIGEVEVDAYVAEGEAADAAFKTELDANADKWDGSTQKLAEDGETKVDAVPEDTDGDGVYEIYTAEEFAYFVKKQIAAITADTVGMEGESYILMNDLDLTNAGTRLWSSPNSSCYFGGTFDGDGHVIKYDAKLTSNGARALFGSIGGNATIKNLSVIGTFTNALAAARDRVGSVIARVKTVAGETAKVSNVYSCVKWVVNSDAAASNYTGGMIGQVEGAGDLKIEDCESANHGNVEGAENGGIINRVSNAKNITINNCKVTGDMIYTGNKNGGVIGVVKTMSGVLTIKGCTVTGDIKGTSQNAGIVGYIEKTTYTETAATVIENCTVEGNITGSGAADGGIIGETKTTKAITIKGCTVKGNVTGTSQVAGILGYLANGGTATTVILQNCKVEGAVKSTASDHKSMSGGILGYVETNVTDLQFLNCDFTGSYEGGRTSGGIAGSLNFPQNIPVRLKDCDVTATLTFVLSNTSNNNCGGLVGRIVQSETTINNCHVNSTMTVTHAPTSSDSQQNGAGGLVGAAYTGTKLYIANSSVKGKFTFTGSSNTYTLSAGNFVGSSTAATGVVFQDNSAAAKLVTTTGKVTLNDADPAVLPIGYQTRPNAGEDGVTGTDDDTYDIRFVFAAKNAYTGYGVKADIRTQGNATGYITAYAKEAYTSVKDEDKNEYAAADYGYDYLYTLVISDVPADINITDKTLYVLLEPFGATKTEETVEVTPGAVQTFGAPISNGVEKTSFDKSNFSATLDSAFTASNAIKIEGGNYDRVASFGVVKTQVPKGECTGGYNDGTLTRPSHYYLEIPKAFTSEEDKAVATDLINITYKVSVDTAGWYDVCIDMRMKIENNANTRQYMFLVNGKGGANAHWLYFKLTNLTSEDLTAIKDASAGSYMTGLKIYLEAGENTLTFKSDPSFSTSAFMHIRNIYLAPGTAPSTSTGN